MSELNKEYREASQLMHSADLSELMEELSVRGFRKRKELPSTGIMASPKENAPIADRRASCQK
ncbi:MAG: hypothetical protein AAF557_20665 [Pseudomonadota bacterium]